MVGDPGYPRPRQRVHLRKLFSAAKIPGNELAMFTAGTGIHLLGLSQNKCPVPPGPKLVHTYLIDFESTAC